MSLTTTTNGLPPDVQGILADLETHKRFPHIKAFPIEKVQRLGDWLRAHPQDVKARPVHNHGPEDGPGLSCPETMAADGSLRGACMGAVEPVSPVAAQGLKRYFPARAPAGTQAGVIDADGNWFGGLPVYLASEVDALLASPKGPEAAAYRFLEPGEVPQPGDEWLKVPNFGDPRWEPCTRFSAPVPEHRKREFRRLASPVPIEEREGVRLREGWRAGCPACLWIGSSLDAAGGFQIADTGDHSEVVCPVCIKEENGGRFVPVEDLEDYYKETRAAHRAASSLKAVEPRPEGPTPETDAVEFAPRQEGDGLLTLARDALKLSRSLETRLRALSAPPVGPEVNPHEATGEDFVDKIFNAYGLFDSEDAYTAEDKANMIMRGFEEEKSYRAALVGMEGALRAARLWNWQEIKDAPEGANIEYRYKKAGDGYWGSMCHPLQNIRDEMKCGDLACGPYLKPEAARAALATPGNGGTGEAARPEFNAIPEMTDPLGKYWVQPADIRKAPMDGKTVTLRPDQIEALLRYDSTAPDGCYPGKCWLCEFRDRPGTLFLLWFGLSEKGQDYCSTQKREVVVAHPSSGGTTNTKENENAA